VDWSDVYEQVCDELSANKYSYYAMAWCPAKQHDWQSHAPSLKINSDDGWFHCYSCGWSGKLDYLARYLQLNPILHVRHKTNVLPKWNRWAQEYGDVSEIAQFGHKFLLQFPQYQGFFKHRKIDQFIGNGRFGYIDGWNLFPILNKSGVIIDVVVRAWKGKGSGTRYVISNAVRSEPPIYVPNWERVLSSDTVFIVFGMIDAWALEDLELPVITGSTGKKLPYEQVKALNKKFIIVPDLGEEKAAYNLVNELGYKSKVLRLPYTDYGDTKDPDEIRVNFGKDKLKELIGV
jgi:DNA primase